MKLSGNVIGKLRNFEDRLDTAMENIKQVVKFSGKDLAYNSENSMKAG